MIKKDNEKDKNLVKFNNTFKKTMIKLFHNNNFIEEKKCVF